MKEQSLHKAIERDSEVSAIIALRAAQFLGISLESLLEIDEVNCKKTATIAQKIAMDYTSLSIRDKELIRCLIQKMKE